MKNVLLLGITLLGGCAGEIIEPASMSYAPVTEGKSDDGRALCGGIAGFTCAESQRCLMKDDYPDAMGVCVGQPEYQTWKDRCAYVKCALPLCPEGFRLQQHANNCCPTCVRSGRPATPATPEGSCRSVNDCDGLIHILCVGSWSCDQGWCSYTCGTSVPL